MKPSAPIMMNAISHPIAFARRGIVAGAARAPTDAPLLNIAVAKALSFLGKYSAVTFIAAGKLPASPRASTERQNRNAYMLMVDIIMAASPVARIRSARLSKPLPITISVNNPQQAWSTAPRDHTTMAHRYPFLVPMKSTNFPAKRLATA